MEVGHRACKTSEFGTLQFFDSSFPRSDISVGIVRCGGLLSGNRWLPARVLSPHAGLFVDGVDPDDVVQGCLADEWLLAAFRIVASAGSVVLADGHDPIVDDVFHTSGLSSTGVYVVRLFKNAQWEAVVIDDFLPTISSDRAPTTSLATASVDGVIDDAPPGTVAFARSRSFEELWVSLLEKAFAKYHGSFADLERGYVHHALHALTGGESEEVYLADATRGTGMASFWNLLLQCRHSQYLLGAAAVVETRHAKHSALTELGIVLGAVYIVYDVRAVDGHRLLKLRCPTLADGASCPLWQGDWSPLSPLWTSRLRLRLGDAEENTFWMSYVDFVSAFRSVYVCRWLDPSRWSTVQHTGWWTGPVAQGLPSVHNVDSHVGECDVSQNPQIQLIVRQPTDVCIVLSQRNPSVETAPDVQHPIAAYVVRTPDSSATRRIGSGVDLCESAAMVRMQELVSRGVAGADTLGDAVSPVAASPPAGRSAGSREGSRRRRRRGRSARAVRDDAEDDGNNEALRTLPASQLRSRGREEGLLYGWEAEHTDDFWTLTSSRVRKLTSANVVMSTGSPVRHREVRMYGQLRPGAYAVLVACYQRQMEGPFTLTVYASHRVYTQSLWPPPEPSAVTPIPLSVVDRAVRHVHAKGTALFARIARRIKGRGYGRHAAVAEAHERAMEAEVASAAMQRAATDAVTMIDPTADAVPRHGWIELTDTVGHERFYFNLESGETQVWRTLSAFMALFTSSKRVCACVRALCSGASQRRCGQPN